MKRKNLLTMTNARAFPNFKFVLVLKLKWRKRTKTMRRRKMKKIIWRGEKSAASSARSAFGSESL